MSYEDELQPTMLPTELPVRDILSSAEKTLREQFVDTYLKDYDAFAACVRIGYGPLHATEYARMFLQDSYTLNRLAERERQRAPVTSEEEALAAKEDMKQVVLNGLLREANYRGPGCSQAARVAALAKLAAIHGMDAPTRNQTEITAVNGAGTFVIPGMMTPEQWEAAAAEQQERLVDATVGVAT